MDPEVTDDAKRDFIPAGLTSAAAIARWLEEEAGYDPAMARFAASIAVGANPLGDLVDVDEIEAATGGKEASGNAPRHRTAQTNSTSGASQARSHGPRQQA